MALLLVVGTACGNADPAGPADDTAQAGTRSAQECPQEPPATPDAGERRVVLSGDFHGENWCLWVSHLDRELPCLSILGDPMPEGDELASGACSPSFANLGWHVTDDANAGDLAYVVYGHAPARTTVVRFSAPGHEAVEVRPQRNGGSQEASFFVERMPAGFFPMEAVAYDGDVEIERKNAPVDGVAAD